MTVLSLALLSAMAVVAPQDSARTQAISDLVALGSQDVLVAQVRLHPDAAREALHGLLRQSAVQTPGLPSRANQLAGADALQSAERLARAYFEAWTDAFLLQEVERFKGWSLEGRRVKLAADSLRRAGNEAFNREGIPAALALWRESLEQSDRLEDVAGTAKSLGNIGAGFYAAGEADSARVYLQGAYERATSIGDFRTAASAVTNLATLALEDNDLAGAADLYTQAVVILARTGEHRFLSAVQHNLALVSMEMGDLGGARSALEESIQLSRLHGYPEDEAESLVSLAEVARTEGEYREAADLLDRALRLSRETGNRVGTAGALHSSGLLWMARGDYRTALGLLEQSLALHTELGRLPDAVDVRQDLARARAATGDLRGGLQDLQEAALLADSRAYGATYAAGLTLTAADLNLALNEFPRALELYRQAGELYSGENDRSGQAEAMEGQGYLSLLRGDGAEARERLSEALRLRSGPGEGNPRASALTRLYLAAAEEEVGDVDAARRILTQAGEVLSNVGDPVGEAAVLATLGGLESRAGAPRVADSLFQLGLETLGGRNVPEVEWRLHAGRGRTLLEFRDPRGAAQELRLAIAAIERSAGTLPLQERSVFKANKADVYNELATVQIRLGLVDEAFETTERSRAQRTLAALSGGRITASAEAPKSLVERQQDVRQRIGDLTLVAPWTGIVQPGFRETREGAGLFPADVGAALAGAQAEYAELLSELKVAAPAYSDRIEPTPATLDEVSAALGSDQALLEYLVAGDSTVVSIVTVDSATALVLDVAGEPLADMVDFARGVIAGRGRGDVGQLWRSPLRRLHEDLIRPVEESGLLQGRGSLVIVPHGELHYLPFQALMRPGDDAFLVERYAVSYAPSASAWVRMLGRAEGAGGVGPAQPSPTEPTVPRILAMAPRVDELPGSRYEVEVIGRLFGDRARVLIGPEATEVALKEAAPSFDIVHLASYGVLNKTNPLFSYVELSGEGIDAGLLEAHEIYGLGLHARLLTLSACETAMGSSSLWDVPPGDDWVSLATTFLEAGAANVLASLWQVEDLATAELMQAFYRNLFPGMGMVESLADAQRELLSNPDTAHPFYWAGFVLVGAGGGGS